MFPHAVYTNTNFLPAAQRQGEVMDKVFFKTISSDHPQAYEPSKQVSKPVFKPVSKPVTGWSVLNVVLLVSPLPWLE